MSQLLNQRYTLLNKSGKHKDKIYNERKTAKQLYNSAIIKLDKVAKKPYFKRRKLSKDKLKDTVYFELKDIMSELNYIIEHHRYTNSAKKDAIKRRNWIKQRIDTMINVGIDYK